MTGRVKFTICCLILLVAYSFRITTAEANETFVETAFSFPCQMHTKNSDQFHFAVGGLGWVWKFTTCSATNDNVLTRMLRMCPTLHHQQHGHRYNIIKDLENCPSQQPGNCGKSNLKTRHGLSSRTKE